MSEFFNKLTTLSYEIFGVLLPGVIASICAIVVWASLGTFVPDLTLKTVPAYSLDNLAKTLDTLTGGRGIGAILVLGVFWYFMGFVLLWLSHSRKSRYYKGIDKPNWKERLGTALRMSMLKPEFSFSPALNQLFELASRKLTPESVPLTWRQFYPVARTFVLQNTKQTLITNYQQKYTLHRSITCAAVVLFWLEVVIVLLFGLALHGLGSINWPLALVTIPCSAVVIVSFSEGYIDNWILWGDSVVTEAFSLLTAPRLEKSKDAGQAGNH